MQYEELAPIERSDAAAELASNDWERVSVALLRLSLHDPDPEWLEDTVLPYTRHEHYWVRGVAAMCLGHVARIHGRLNLKKCLPAIRELLDNDETKGKAEDALEDIEMFIGGTDEEKDRATQE
ncbi:MAG: hypothetical protein MJE77_38465 [Proteobacteria bacterium]|nr:hypothetical protein [Pseudomonadota bacterium]